MFHRTICISMPKYTNHDHEPLLFLASTYLFISPRSCHVFPLAYVVIFYLSSEVIAHFAEIVVYYCLKEDKHHEKYNYTHNQCGQHRPHLSKPVCNEYEYVEH